MRFFIAISALCATTVFARAVPSSTAEDSGPVVTCALLGKGCKSIFDVSTGTFSCTCSVNQANPGNFPDLARFYTEPSYRGIEYQGHGNYRSCQNLPDGFDQETQSMKSNLNPSTICCIFTAKDCVKEGRHWTSVDASVQEFQGYYENGVRSFMCNLWVDESSTCDGL